MTLRPIRRDGGPPLHVQVERALRELAAASPPGTLLPPELDLAAQLGVSRTTVRQAMQQLVQAGLVVRTAGRGTEVVDRQIETQLDFTPFVRAFEASGHEVRTAEAVAIVRPADEEESATLELEPGTPIHELRRLRLVDGAPYALLVTVLPPGVPAPDDLMGSLYEHFDEAGIHLSRLSDALSATSASRDLARALRVRVGAPVLVIRRIAHDAAGRPVEVTRTHLRSGAGYTVEHKR